jgi:hypothetical protein
MIGQVGERMTELDIAKCRNSNPILRPIIIVLEQIEIVDFEMFGVSGRVLGRIDTQRSFFCFCDAKIMLESAELRQSRKNS